MKQKTKAPLSMYATLIMTALIPLVVGVVAVTLILSISSRNTVIDINMAYLETLTQVEGQSLETGIDAVGKEIALSPEKLKATFGNVGMKGVDSSYAYIVEGATGTMLYHPTESKIGEPVTNSVVKGLVEKIASGQSITTGQAVVVSYVFNGATKYAAYYSNAAMDFIMVISADQDDLLATSTRVTQISIVVALALVLIFCVIVILIGRLIASPLKAVAKVTEEMADGNVNVDFKAKSHIKEIYQTIEATEVLKTNLGNIAAEISGNMGELNNNMGVVAQAINTSNSAKDGITEAVEEMAKGATEMAESVQNTASSMAEIGTGIEEIAALTEEANANAEKATQISEDAKGNLAELIGANRDTIAITDEVVLGITDAGEAVKEISKAAQAITDIASQTNLLSLNASIEAARAGEAGRGFAVVASEISSLATQSDQSAKEIQAIITNIVTKSENNTKLANRIKESVENEGTVLNGVNKSFENVTECIDVMARGVSDISDKASVLDTAKNSVMDEISTLSSISEENAASTEETSASTQELGANIENINEQTEAVSEVVAKVSDSIAFFKL